MRTWVHVAWTHQKSALRLYINGVQRAALTDNVEAPAANSAPVYGGSSSLTAASGVRVEDLRYLPQAASADLIAELVAEKRGTLSAPKH